MLSKTFLIILIAATRPFSKIAQNYGKPRDGPEFRLSDIIVGYPELRAGYPVKLVELSNLLSFSGGNPHA